MTGPQRFSRTANDSHFIASQKQLTVRVTLSCGHTVPMRSTPINDRAKFGCSLGLGCGYRLWWVTWVRGDARGVNKTYAAMQENSAEQEEQEKT